MSLDLKVKAEAFRAMHVGGTPLVLPNAWDAVSAKLFEAAGCKALATTSAGIAYALGWPDGERIPRDAMVAAVGRIVRAVDVPVTADMEAGFAKDVEGLAETVRAIIDVGAIGLNIEDSEKETKQLYDIPLAVERVRAVRSAAERAGIPLVINARSDVFLLGVGDPSERVGLAAARLNGYRRAGADCLFVPGVRDAETIGALVRAVEGPLNVLVGPGTPPVAELQRLGVARVTIGPAAAHAAMTVVRRVGEELLGRGTYGFLEGAITYPEMNALMGKRRLDA
jgi:2-methylisocitrate lyase-like PEP mutase family enzyme